jgi:hypothetical protein
MQNEGDNIKIDLKEIGSGGMDWIDLAKDRGKWKTLVNKVKSLRVPWNAGKFLSTCTIGVLSRRAQLHDDDNDYLLSSETLYRISSHKFQSYFDLSRTVPSFEIWRL